MNKFKVGDEVKIIKNKDGSEYDNYIGTIQTIAYVDSVEVEFATSDETLMGSYWDFEEIELYQKECKVMKIQEVLKEENIGKKFLFDGSEYVLTNEISLVYILEKETATMTEIEYLENLKDIINGDFTLVEEYKEIDSKEGIRSLLYDEVVEFELGSGYVPYKFIDGWLHSKRSDGDFSKTYSGINDLLSMKARIKL